jgi:hypothetical protein
MRRYQRFHRSLENGEPHAVRLAKLLDQAGARIVKHSKKQYDMPPGATYAVGILNSLSLSMKPEKFIWLVSCIREPGQIRSDTLLAIREMAICNPHWSEEQITAQIAKLSLVRIRAQIRKLGAGSGWPALCSVLTQELTLALGKGRQQ